MSSELLFDKQTKMYIQKDSVVNLNLVSKARKDQIKLVGKVGLDLAEVANRNV